MGDVTIILGNKTSGGEGGDDEDSWNEMSGSGDGDSEGAYLSSKPPDRSSSFGPSGAGKDKGADEQDSYLIYVIIASAVFAIVIIIIVIIFIFCRRHVRAKKARQKTQVSDPGNEMKTIMMNRETRVFGNIAGDDALDPQSLEKQRMLSRLMAPPSSVAPPPPTTTAKARVAPEAEKLLKAIVSSGAQHNSQDKLQPELSHLLQSGDAEARHHYEEIGHIAKVTETNQKESADNSFEENFTAEAGSQGSSNIKNSDHNNKADKKNPPVAKPRKNLGNTYVADEVEGGYFEVKELGSAV